MVSSTLRPLPQTRFCSFLDVMLELKIVFVSSNAGQLSAQSSLCSRFLACWPHPLIPLMPEALHTYCDAPFPVIVGVQTMPPNVADALRYESAKGGCGDNPASELVAVLLDEDVCVSQIAFR